MPEVNGCTPEVPDIRPALVEKAVAFLRTESVRNSSPARRRAFLTGKGLNAVEMDFIERLNLLDEPPPRHTLASSSQKSSIATTVATAAIVVGTGVVAAQRAVVPAVKWLYHNIERAVTGDGPRGQGDGHGDDGMVDFMDSAGAFVDGKSGPVKSQVRVAQAVDKAATRTSSGLIPSGDDAPVAQSEGALQKLLTDEVRRRQDAERKVDALEKQVTVLSRQVEIANDQVAALSAEVEKFKEAALTLNADDSTRKDLDIPAWQKEEEQ